MFILFTVYITFRIWTRTISIQTVRITFSFITFPLIFTCITIFFTGFMCIFLTICKTNGSTFIIPKHFINFAIVLCMFILFTTHVTFRIWARTISIRTTRVSVSLTFLILFHIGNFTIVFFEYFYQRFITVKFTFCFFTTVMVDWTSRIQSVNFCHIFFQIFQTTIQNKLCTTQRCIVNFLRPGLTTTTLCIGFCQNNFRRT